MRTMWFGASTQGVPHSKTRGFVLPFAPSTERSEGIGVRRDRDWDRDGDGEGGWIRLRTQERSGEYKLDQESCRWAVGRTDRMTPIRIAVLATLIATIACSHAAPAQTSAPAGTARAPDLALQ